MADPLGLIGAAGGAGAGQPVQGPGRAEGRADPGAPSFKDLLLKNLDEVNRLQQDATRATEDYLTGQRTDLEGVLTATQKADTAFKALQAVRNKVIQAYEEIQQMRV